MKNAKTPIALDNQLTEWRKQFDREIPERVGLAFYTRDNGEVEIEVYMADENMWMSQQIMSQLFGVAENTITEHLAHIYAAGELDKNPTTRKIRVVRQEGKRQVEREIQFYNLDAVISVGYRVNSIQATQFRKFATRVLHEYIQKGFVLNDDRFKSGRRFDESYFKEMLERIRDIRLSERRIYLQITDIFALASDYDKDSTITKEFFAFIQNKLHYAIAGNTAAEIIHKRADAGKDNMGLTSWAHSPDGKIYKTDVTVAKNYLSDDELHRLRLAVTTFLDLAEMRAERQLPTTMQDWIGFMSGYLDLNGFPVLQDLGKISKEQADAKALGEYEKFQPIQDAKYISDFEKRLLVDLKDTQKKLESAESKPKKSTRNKV
ncbi:MAG: virulence RhuM family protein [Alphaproteobacteria bacterium]|nr:virulence RhuM family protein [Alphaproteobacteria bacterium]